MVTAGLGHLYFGMAAAENEVAEDPERFLRTYLDRWDIMNEVERHRRFLVLGPKGTGKSAAAHYVRLAWEKSLGPSAVFPTFIDFDDLNRSQSPLSQLDKKLVGDVTTLTDTAWRLFIGIRLLDSLLSDAGCNLGRDAKVLQFAQNLKQAGLASDDFPQVLRRVRERKGLLGLTRYAGFEGSSTDTDEVGVSQVGDALARHVVNAETPNRHLLVIDGLDKAIGDNAAYWQTLAALVRVADSLTRALKEADAHHVYVLIMCRSDVFRRVRFADAAKIAADGAIHMDWGAEAENPRDVQLWEYIARKAEVPATYLFEQLPRRIVVGGGQELETNRYILQFTRYTPRDLTLLFNTFRAVCDGTRLKGEEVRRAVDAFASRHLLTEMMSEATGLLPDEMIDRFESILGSMPQRVFSRAELENSMKNSGFSRSKDVDRLGEYLFLQGAIGNYRPGARYVQFYHRRDAYKWHREGPWVMHTGLVYAFNIPWTATDKGASRREGPRDSGTASPRRQIAEAPEVGGRGAGRRVRRHRRRRGGGNKSGQ